MFVDHIYFFFFLLFFFLASSSEFYAAGQDERFVHATIFTSFRHLQSVFESGTLSQRSEFGPWKPEGSLLKLNL